MFLAVRLIRGLVNRHCPTQPLFLQVRHWRLRVICPWLVWSTWMFTSWCELPNILTSASLITRPLICGDPRNAACESGGVLWRLSCPFRRPAITFAGAQRVVKHGACQILANCIWLRRSRWRGTARAAQTAEIRRVAARTWADAALGV